MDIDLLSKMIKELIIDSDEVALPGVGTFVAEIVPSSFSDKGYTINPPYRKLSFRQRINKEDISIAKLYAKANNIELPQAELIINDFLEEMGEVLKERKTIIFPGLGRLRATRENNFFFVCNEDLDIYPDGFGLEALSLKTHNESTEQVYSQIAELKTIVTETESIEAEETTAVADEAISMSVTEPAPQATDTETVKVVESAEEQSLPAETQEKAEEDSKTSDENAGETVKAEEDDSDNGESIEIKDETIDNSEVAAEETIEPEAKDEIAQVETEEDTAQNEIDEAAIINGKIRKTIIISLCVIIGALLLFTIISRIAPDLFMDLLYNKEEQDIIKSFNF